MVNNILIEVGMGKMVLSKATYGDKPALLIVPAMAPGKPGALATRENQPIDRFLSDEIIITFPEEHRRNAVYAAFFHGVEMERPDTEPVQEK